MAAAEPLPRRLITNDQAGHLVLRGLLNREAGWRERVGDEAYRLAIAQWEGLLGDHTPDPHAVYPHDDPKSMRTSLRADEAWWRQALGVRYDQVLAYRPQLDTPDGEWATDAGDNQISQVARDPFGGTFPGVLLAADQCRRRSTAGFRRIPVVPK
jgi:hypothetical protein